MKYTQKMNRQQKRADQKARRDQQMAGSGVHIYQNTSRATLFLPKPAIGGHTRIAAGQKFQGDSYFERLIGQGLRKISTVVPNDPPKLDNHNIIIEDKSQVINESLKVEQEGKKMNDKLILDQPERYTQEGQTEQVVVEKRKKLNESNPEKEENSKLINEDPMSGVEIILN